MIRRFFLLKILIIFSFCCSISFASEIKIKIISKDRNELRARISNDQLKKDSPFFKTFEKLEVIGEIKNPESKILNMEWNKVKLNGQESNLPQPLKSQIKVKSDARDLKSGSEFTVHGDPASIINSVEEMLNNSNTEESRSSKSNNQFSTSSASFSNIDNSAFISSQAENAELLTTSEGEFSSEGEITSTSEGCSLRFDYVENKVFVQTRRIQDGLEVESCSDSATSYNILQDYEICSTSGMFKYYYLDNNQVRNDIGICQYDNAIITTTEGCYPRVDYTLNKVYIQERATQNGVVIQSCSDTSESYDLLRDYDSCSNQEDLSNLLFRVNFQYYYFDASDNRNDIDSCQEDTSQRSNIVINRNYENCDQFIDLGNMRIYDQYQETYTNQAGSIILLNECQIDYGRSFILSEDFTACGLNHNYDSGYSTRLRNIGYTDSDGVYQEIYNCLEDTSTTYPHISTQDTCTPIIANGIAQIFSRKYVNIDGVTTYVTECQPEGSATAILQEDCATIPYTHDFDTGTSYRNVNLYYMDGGLRVDVSSCIQSTESFTHQIDTAICSSTNDDTNKVSNIYGRIFFVDNGQTIYATDSCSLTSEVAYTQIGTYWTSTSTLNNQPLSVTISGNNARLGSSQGDPTNPNITHYFSNIGRTCYYRDYNDDGVDNIISSSNLADLQSTVSSFCAGYSNPIYNSNAIDTAYSNSGAITYSANINTSYELGRCTYRNTNNYFYHSQQNAVYYRRCSNYRCNVTILNRYNLYRRSDNSKYHDTSISNEIKYVCGTGSSLSGTEILF